MSKHRKFKLHLPDHQGKPVNFMFDEEGRMLLFYFTDDKKFTQLEALLNKLPLTQDELTDLLPQLFEGSRIEEVSIPTFADFYAAYPNKTGKQDAQKALDKLPDSQKVKALAHLPAHLARKAKEGTALKYPATYLNSKPWND